MESTMIGLRFPSTIPNQYYSICMPSGLHAVRSTEPRLSFFQYSSLSLPKSSRTRPFEHIMMVPIISMVNNSLPPKYDRVDKRRETIDRASPFLRNIGSGRRTNIKGNAAPVDVPSQLHIDHHFELMEMVQKLKESHQYDTALKLLKRHEPKVLDNLEAAYQLKMEIMHILHRQGKTLEALEYAKEFYDNKAVYAKRFRYESFYATKLMEIAVDLKESKHYDLAVKLLKEQDPEVEDDPDASYYVKMEIMHILYLQGKYDEARIYADELEKNEDIYRPHFRVGLFYALKSGILCASEKEEEAIKYMEKFRENRSEAIPLTPPDKDESTKHHGS